MGNKQEKGLDFLETMDRPLGVTGKALARLMAGWAAELFSYYARKGITVDLSGIEECVSEIEIFMSRLPEKEKLVTSKQDPQAGVLVFTDDVMGESFVTYSREFSKTLRRINKAAWENWKS